MAAQIALFVVDSRQSRAGGRVLSGDMGERVLRFDRCGVQSPDDPRPTSALGPTGIASAHNRLTQRGCGEAEMEELGHIIADVAAGLLCRIAT